jgi:hypothetical protein
MDRQAFRKEFFLNLFVRPVTLVPLVAGITGLVAGFSVGLWQVVAAGLALATGSAGILATRFFLQSEGIARETYAQLERREQEQNERKLDAFRQRLLEDDDPRNEQMLDELRRLVTTIKSGAHGGHGWVASMGTHVATELLPQVQHLFDECLRMLEQTLELWKTAQGVRDRGLRHPLLQQREEIFVEVQRSIASLTVLISGIQQIGTQPLTGRGDTRLAQLREELDRSLAIHQRVLQEQRRALEGPSIDECIIGS